MRTALGMAMLALALTACGESENEAAAPTETVTATVTETVTETVTASPTPEETTSEPTPTEAPTAEEDPYEDFRDDEGFVTRDDYPSSEYGLAWPLTVPAGFLACPESFGEGAGSVTFITLNGDEYALNGQAQQDYPDIRPITKRGQIVLPLIDAALALC
ncbi:hypothetical protein [Nocardioides sp. Leaf307]|uniref:hypothetical protein n=1 Tax=Nocardioides sp. Leaf307 TaxID=1736331 RepID=UPI0007151DF0|nr:hypothetical protein [Nocardioides sp. Leaf307]KQQ42134.1 hypothetical protein ASF50_14955 [Nocardioides sp. Leaf307]